MSDPNAPRIPVWVVTGFLGAGKTTAAISRLRRPSRRIAVIENEFGETGVDGTLLAGRLSGWLSDGWVHLLHGSQDLIEALE